MNNTHSLFIIVLAAGKGKRINAVDIPKPMFPIKGKPMLGYVADMLKTIKTERPIMVVGFQGQKVLDYLEDRDQFDFVWQKEQLGTGHAVMAAEELLKGKDGTTVVINGDNPFFKPETIERIKNQLEEKQAVMAISSVELDPSFSFGRIITNADGHVQEIIEVKNATPQQLEVRLMNAGLYAFNNDWLWRTIHEIQKDDLSQEFYITDLVAIAAQKGETVIAVPITHPNEAIGINTLDNLKAAEDALVSEA
jgi:bifunctional UDP-N-acetylglucosamine pyrophosphorylase/glucosamine-1-phosphate N-acetyltransferase